MVIENESILNTESLFFRERRCGDVMNRVDWRKRNKKINSSWGFFPFPSCKANAEKSNNNLFSLFTYLFLASSIFETLYMLFVSWRSHSFGTMENLCFYPNEIISTSLVQPRKNYFQSVANRFLVWFSTNAVSSNSTRFKFHPLINLALMLFLFQTLHFLLFKQEYLSANTNFPWENCCNEHWVTRPVSGWILTPPKIQLFC